MNRIHLLAIYLATLVAVAPSALSDSKATITSHALPKVDNFGIPLGFVLIEKDVSLKMKNLPLSLMGEAVSDYSKEDIGEAAGDLKSASRILRATEGNRIDEKTALRTKISADNLDLIAKDIRRAQIKSVETLKERLGQVAYYQSVTRETNAKNEWGRRQIKQAGYDLDAAATALNRSITWSSKAHSSDSDATIKNSHAIADKLISGSGWKENEVKTALSDLAVVNAAIGPKILPESFKAAEQPSEF